jgi:hypothetical protein
MRPWGVIDDADRLLNREYGAIPAPSIIDNGTTTIPGIPAGIRPPRLANAPLDGITGDDGADTGCAAMLRAPMLRRDRNCADADSGRTNDTGGTAGAAEAATAAAAGGRADEPAAIRCSAADAPAKSNACDDGAEAPDTGAGIAAPMLLDRPYGGGRGGTGGGRRALAVGGTTDERRDNAAAGGSIAGGRSRSVPAPDPGPALAAAAAATGAGARVGAGSISEAIGTAIGNGSDAAAAACEMRIASDTSALASAASSTTGTGATTCCTANTIAGAVNDTGVGAGGSGGWNGPVAHTRSHSCRSRLP